MIKRLLSTTLLLTISFIFIQAQDSKIPGHTDQQAEVVINHKMIERFRQADFDSTAMTFQDIVREYNMEEVSLLVHSYHYSEFNFTDKPQMDEKLAEMKSEMSHDVIRVRPLVTDNAPAKQK